MSVKMQSGDFVSKFLAWLKKKGYYNRRAFIQRKFALAIYLVILTLFKEFTKEDFWFYIDTLNIRKMGDYIKEELRHK